MPKQSFVFIGISGCGKGTQIDLMVKHLNKIDPNGKIINIQSGAEFRNFIKGESLTEKKSKGIYDKGDIQPAFLAVHIWSHYMIKNMDENSHLIIDGAPRTYPEALVMDSAFKFYDFNKRNIIHIEISREEAMRRLLSRKRFDDNVDDINVRLDFYYRDVVPAVDYYKNNSDYNFISVNGEKSIQEVHKDIVSMCKF